MLGGDEMQSIDMYVCTECTCMCTHSLICSLLDALICTYDTVCLIFLFAAVKIATFSTKPGSIARTKGGIGICLTLFGSSFLFINSHLTGVLCTYVYKYVLTMYPVYKDHLKGLVKGDSVDRWSLYRGALLQLS